MSKVLVKPWKISERTTIPGIRISTAPGPEARRLRRDWKEANDEEIYWIEISQRPDTSAQEWLAAHGWVVEQFGGVFLED